MNEHVLQDSSHKDPILHAGKLRKKNPFVEFKYSAKNKEPMPPINLMRGRPDWTFKMFEDTQYKVEIPYRGYATTDKALREIDALTPDIVRTEPFNLFYRHMYMLQHVGSPTLVAQFVPTIIERVSAETNEFVESACPHDPKKRKRAKEDVYIAAMACLETCEEDKSIRMPKSVVKQLYQDAIEQNSISWRYALTFDKRNMMYGESIDIAGRFREILTAQLLVSSKAQNEKNALLESTSVDPEFQANLLIYSLLQTHTNEQIPSIIQQIAPVMGVENIRKTIREYVEDNPSFREKFDMVFDYLGFDPTTAHVNLARDIYEKIDFSAYKPNREMQNFETEFLKKELAGNSQVLDVPCGTGRHIEALDDQGGLHVAGIDIVQRHINHIKAKNPKLNAQVGSWFTMPFPDRAFDAAYCLGRSFTHNTTIPDAVMCLQEMGRVIKDEGFIILDLPDPSVGDYKNDIAKTKKIAKAKGLKGVLPGMLTDSPDLQHYFDRYAPDTEAFDAIAKLAGLHAEKLMEVSYRSVSGINNINTYWKLTKDQRPIRMYDHFSGSFFDTRSYLLDRIKREHSRLSPKPGQTTLSL